MAINRCSLLKKAHEIPKYEQSLSHAKLNCKYYIIFTTMYRRKIVYGQLRESNGRTLRRLGKCKMLKL